MKTSLLLLACLGATAFAQSSIQTPARQRIINPLSQMPGSDAPAFPDNYLVTLSVAEGDKAITELVIATSRPEFKADSVDPSMTFAGTLTLSEDGTVLLSYILGAEIAVVIETPQSDTDVAPTPTDPARPKAIQYKTQTAQAQVRLRLGEPLNVLRTGPRTYRLTVSKLPPAEAKSH